LSSGIFAKAIFPSPATPTDFAAAHAPPRWRCGRSRWSWRLLFHGAGDGVLDVVDLIDDLLIDQSRHRGFGVALDGFDLAADVFGGLGGLLGQFLDFVGHDGEAFARSHRRAPLQWSRSTPAGWSAGRCW
jgi:hypothetical protein